MTQVTQTEVWIAAMARAAAHYGQVVDTQSVRQQMRWYEQQPIARQLEQISHLMGLSISLRHREKLRWRNQILPVLAETDDGGVIVIESLNDEGIATYWLNDGGDLQREAELTELIKHSQGIIVLVGIAERGRDTRIDDFVKPYRKHWFWQHFRGAKRQIGEISLASVVGNVLALAGILFSMQVYDRVIPAQSIPTLWVLFFGVLLAAALEYAIRLSRTVVSDLMGKSIDLNVSGMLFAARWR